MTKVIIIFGHFVKAPECRLYGKSGELRNVRTRG
jgi:hypothetical protein